MVFLSNLPYSQTTGLPGENGTITLNFVFEDNHPLKDSGLSMGNDYAMETDLMDQPEKIVQHSATSIEWTGNRYMGDFNDGVQNVREFHEKENKNVPNESGLNKNEERKVVAEDLLKVLVNELSEHKDGGPNRDFGTDWGANNARSILEELSNDMRLSRNHGWYIVPTEEKHSGKIESKNFPGLYWGIAGEHVYIMPRDASLDNICCVEDFNIVDGLSGANGTVSFESTTKPGHFLRHLSRELFLDSKLTTRGVHTFLRDATFYAWPNLFIDGFVAFESVNFVGHFIRHRELQLMIETGGGEQFRNDASFRIM